jgi:electron transfer flavoprotein alpha subunit
MGNILVVAEHREGTLRKVTYPTVTFAQEVKRLEGGDVIGVVLGHAEQNIAENFARHGVDRVVYVDDPSFANPLAESWAPAVVDLARELGATLICGPASVQGRDYLPRVATALEAGMAADVVAVWKDGAELRFKRPMWAGNILAIVAIDTPVKVVSVRPTEFEPAAEGAAAPVETRQKAYPTGQTEFVAFREVKSARPDLNDATVIVAGGRGLRAAEHFGMLEQLADLFGGAVGASRAAVDSGMAPFDWQIGQTGKIVAPDLYFAIAISGAIQHLAGMKGSKHIVAINKDPEAPIFQIADYGLVADAFKVVPELVEKVRAAKGE